MNRKLWFKTLNSPRVLFIVVLLVLASFASAPAFTLLTPGYRGDKIQAGYQIPIKSGEHTGAYRTNDVSVNYRYLKSGDDLNMSGTVRFVGGIPMNFNYVDYFHLGMLLGNSEGAILSNHGLTSASWVNLTGPSDQVHFSRNLVLPPKTTVMAFTYTGQASEGGAGGNTQFWQYPIVG